MSAAYLLPAEQGVPMSQFFQIHPTTRNRA